MIYASTPSVLSFDIKAVLGLCQYDFCTFIVKLKYIKTWFLDRMGIQNVEKEKEKEEEKEEKSVNPI